MSDVDKIIEALLAKPERWQAMPMSEWFACFKQKTADYLCSIDRAFLAGRLSSNVGFAFAGAYQSAIEALFKLDKPLLASVCITEVGGNHPRAINTRLNCEGDVFRLRGEKSFVSGAKDAGMIYVACRDDREGNGYDAEGRPLIKMVALHTDRPGIEIQEMPELGFMTEISHGKVKLDELVLGPSDILPGDGYLRYVKAFRTYEDLHVVAALCAYRLGEAIEGKWGEVLIEAHMCVMLAIRSLAGMDLESAYAHLALSACRRDFERLIALGDESFAKSNPQGFANWQRDSRILKVAAKAHKSRTEKAWQNILPQA